MGPEVTLENLRRAIRLSSNLDESSLSKVTKLFSAFSLQTNDYLLSAGEYPLYLAFVEKGIIVSYYTNLQEYRVIRGIYIPGVFVLPLPSFIYRKPSFMTFQAITGTFILRAKYADLQKLEKTNQTIHVFLKALIDQEWIINRELHDAGLHVYNHQTRYGLFHNKYKQYISQIPAEIIASYLNIPVKQLEKIQHQIGK